MKATQTGKPFIPAPEGTHVAICYQFIHIGTIEESYLGELKEMDKIRLTFELCNEKKVFKENEEPRPIVISQEYTFSMGSKANLRKLVEGIIGTSLLDAEAEAFDVDSILGTPCLLTIKHKTSSNGKKYALISSAAPLVKGMEDPQQSNKNKKLLYQEWDQEFFDGLPEFIRDKMESSLEYKKKFGETKELDPNEIPF